MSLVATCSTLLPAPTARRLIAAAGRAPSPDNNQPWALRVQPDALEVCHCRQRGVPSDVDDLFAGLALGAAIENIVLEASRELLTTDVQYVEHPFARSSDPEPVATLHFAPGGTPDPLAEAIAARTTNRRPYAATPLESRQSAALAEAIEDPDCELLWLTDRPRLRHLASLVYEADRIRFEYQPFHDELHRVLRFGREEAQRAGDGLEFRSLEIPSLAKPLFRWLRPWPRMRLLNRIGLSRMFARNSITLVKQSAAVGLLTTRRDDAVGFLQAGRAFERTWLAATALDLSVQPLAALPLFLRRLSSLGPGAFLPGHARKLTAARDQFAQLFPELQARTPVMLFRVGQCGPPSARSYRFPTDQIELR